MSEYLKVIKEAWICPPTCIKEHTASEVHDMLLYPTIKLDGLRRYGLRPCRVDAKGRWLYLCQDVQDFVYGLEIPVGINYQVGEICVQRFKNRGFDHKAGIYRYRGFDWFEIKSTRTIKTKKPNRARVPISGFIYLLEWNGYHKIGRAKDVARRAVDIINIPTSFKILHSFATQDAVSAENYMHRHCAAYRLKDQREWYQLPEESLVWICSLIDGEIDGR